MSPFVRAGRRTAIIWHDNFTARYVYNDAGQLIRVEEDDDGNGTSERTLSEYVYDRMGRLIERHVGGQDPHGAQAGPGGNAASGIAYTYEADGEVVQMHHLFSDQSVTFTYAYDGAGYLEAEHANAAGWLWSAGGQTQSRDFSSTDSVRAGEPTNVQNQYGAVVHVEGSTTTNYTLSYDFSDNLSGDGTRSFLHDTRNRLTGLVQSGQTIQYRYDVIGRRTGVSLNNGASWTRFSHAGGMETGELNDAGQYLQRYIPGPGVDQREAMITVNPSTGAATARHYYHANRLGSVIALADASGALSDRYVYTPYGVEAPLNTSGNPFRFTGRRYDPESELYYYRARYYWPEIGRFLETDPIGYADQMNLYAYVANNPLNATDPSGMVKGDVCNSGGCVTVEAGDLHQSELDRIGDDMSPRYMQQNNGSDFSDQSLPTGLMDGGEIVTNAERLEATSRERDLVNVIHQLSFGLGPGEQWAEPGYSQLFYDVSDRADGRNYERSQNGYALSPNALARGARNAVKVARHERMHHFFQMVSYPRGAERSERRVNATRHTELENVVMKFTNLAGFVGRYQVSGGRLYGGSTTESIGAQGPAVAGESLLQPTTPINGD